MNDMATMDTMALAQPQRIGTRGAMASAARLGRFSVLLVLVAIVWSGCGDSRHGARTSVPCCPVCGDGVCNGDESGCNCPVDCGTAQACTEIVPVCGNGTCETGATNGERHESCAADCPLKCAACQSNSRVYFKGTIFPEDHKCPLGTTAASRVGDLIICGTCESSSNCTEQLKPACLSHCVSDCTLDTGECCPVRECSLD